MANLSFWDRLSEETPKFFKRLQVIVLSLAGVAATILGLTELNLPGMENFVLPSVVIKICQWIIFLSLGAAGATKLTTTKSSE